MGLRRPDAPNHRRPRLLRPLTILNSQFHIILPSDDIASQLNDILDLLPPWRKQKALSYKFPIDRFLCAKAFMLLKKALSRHYHIHDDLQFSYNQYGKPFLANHPDIHFNLSHCRKGCACAVSDTPVGIDIEEITYDDDLARFILSDDEYRKVSASDNPALAFTTAWTQRESYLKMLGCGIVDNIKEINTLDTHFSTKSDLEAGYVITVACSTKP